VSVLHFASNRKKNCEFIKLNLFVFLRDRGNVDVSHFASNREKIIKLIKLNLFIFDLDEGKCERFAFCLEPKKN
jgi:hypothetical protein